LQIAADACSGCGGCIATRPVKAIGLC
jgi:NAD-dependent dihydropyrimidine dehydrogenase PreA subunit